MSVADIRRDFQEKVCAEVEIASEGKDRYRVFTPFMFDDGDCLSIVLRKEGQGWVLSDEGHTFMHLSYAVDLNDVLRSGNRNRIIQNALSFFGVEDRNGELLATVEHGGYGDALYSFVQALLKISDVKFLSREQVRSTFIEDFRELLSDVVPEERRQFGWHDPERDPEGNYAVDCRINGQVHPLFVYALPTDARARDATIALLKFEQWAVHSRSMAVFENQEEINRKVLARFSDVCEKQFSSLHPNRDRITRYINEEALS